MCYIEDYENLHPTCDEFVTGGGEIILSYGSKIDALGLIGHTLNFIENWLKTFEQIYDSKKTMYRDKMSGLFKKIPVTIT